MMRNEILETGEFILLYNSGLWKGRSVGLGKLIECSYKTDIKEEWIVVTDNGEELPWIMLSTHKELPPCENILRTVEPTYRDDEIPF